MHAAVFRGKVYLGLWLVFEMHPEDKNGLIGWIEEEYMDKYVIKQIKQMLIVKCR